MPKTLRWFWRAVELLLSLIGAAGVPDNIKTWSAWIAAMDQDLARWLLLLFVAASLLFTESKAIRAKIFRVYRATRAHIEWPINVGRNRIEVEIVRGLNAITFTPAFSAHRLDQPDLTELEAFIGGLQIVNNDNSDTTVDKVWLEIRGKEVLSEPSRWDFEGEKLIGPRRRSNFQLTYCQTYKGKLSKDECRKRIRLRAKVLGFGVLSIRIPEHVFTGPYYS